MPELKAELERALAIEDQTERQLEVVAILSEALADIGVRPVVVGGLAVAYWTAGSYLTGDIDVLMPSSPAVDERVRSLGFESEGLFWLIPKANLFLEAPGSFLEPGAEAQEVRLASGRSVRVIRPEDVLVDRLHEFVATGHASAFRQAVWLLAAAGLERTRLEARAASEDMTEALASVKALAERVRSGETIEPWELHEVARGLQ